MRARVDRKLVPPRRKHACFRQHARTEVAEVEKVHTILGRQTGVPTGGEGSATERSAASDVGGRCELPRGTQRKLRVDAVRYIGGYGRMSWIRKAEWQVAEPDPLGPSAAGTIAHMDTDHADALVLYCKAFSKATEVASATMTGIDRYGFEMSAKTKEGPRPIRLAFAKPVSTPAEARAALITMLPDAKCQLG